MALGVPEVPATPEVPAGPEGPEAVPAGFPQEVAARPMGATAVAVVRQAPLMVVEVARWTTGTSGSP